MIKKLPLLCSNNKLSNHGLSPSYQQISISLAEKSINLVPLLQFFNPQLI
ncbi:protein of unknown function [Shewanella benthica]|uniref:Uncharacterized protein n=1 Tax=Shewanella benthica TaxID=43661 RepID=A0A330M3P4_9GAMM|nr:protein of unknown function [Shewanella benthica]